MRVGQLVNSHSRSRRTVFVEQFGVHLVVSTEVVHGHQVGGDLNQITEFSTHFGEDCRDVFDDGTRLRPNVERRRPHLVDLDADKRVVGSTRTGPGDIDEIADHLDVGELSARLRQLLDDLRPTHRFTPFTVTVPSPSIVHCATPSSSRTAAVAAPARIT